MMATMAATETMVVADGTFATAIETGREVEIDTALLEEMAGTTETNVAEALAQTEMTTGLDEKRTGRRTRPKTRARRRSLRSPVLLLEPAKR